MRNLVLTLLAGGVMAGTGMAQAADVTIYGRAHLATSYLDDGADYSAANFSSNSSRIGFRVGHELRPGVRGLIQLEGGVNFSNTEDESFTSRDSFAGLEGDWGLLRGGRFNTPNKVVRGRVDLFGDQVGETRNIVRGNYRLDPSDSDTALEGFDERFRRGIAYRTPMVGGFFADVHYSFDTASSANAADGNENDAWSASVTYHDGPLYAAVAHERWNREQGDDERDVTRFAAYYDVAAFRLTGFAQTASDPDDNAYGAGVRYALRSDVHLKGQYYWLDADDGDFDADMIAMGVDYRYSPELQFYVNYARIDNDDLQTRQPWVAASPLEQSGGDDFVAGETAYAVAFGAIYNF